MEKLAGKPFVLLGVNSAYHEPAACLLVDGELVAMAEQAISTFLRSSMDAMVMGPFLVEHPEKQG